MRSCFALLARDELQDQRRADGPVPIRQLLALDAVQQLVQAVEADVDVLAIAASLQITLRGARARRALQYPQLQVIRLIRRPDRLRARPSDDLAPQRGEVAALRDGDGLTDQIDDCPNEKGIIEEKGCPAKDDDGDTVPNHVDNCPQEKGDPANQGYPVKAPESRQAQDRIRLESGYVPGRGAS